MNKTTRVKLKEEQVEKKKIHQLTRHIKTSKY